MQRFVADSGWGAAAPVLLAGDASFRKYFRVRRPDGRPAVLMDAPPPQEDVRPFIHVAGLLRDFGLSAPDILAADAAEGFLLLEDFGDDTYTRLLGAGHDESGLYRLAVDALIALHRAAATAAKPDLPPYDTRRLLDEAALLTDWYMPAVLGAPTGSSARNEYLDLWRASLDGAMSAAPATLVMRDYHVDNLLLLPGREGVRACGLLDFQDAVWGPPAYDLVSLLEDARRDVPPPLRDAMMARYLAAFPELDPIAFRRSASVLAAQRNCKILGIFTRLWKRDGKPAYLAHVPRLWRLLDADLRAPSLAPIAAWLAHHIPPARRGMPDTSAGSDRPSQHGKSGA